MPAPTDVNLLGVVSLGALIGGVGSTVANFLIEAYKANSTLKNDIIKKRHELLDLRRLDAYRELYKELYKSTLITPTDSGAILAQVDVIETFLDENLLYFGNEERQLVYGFTNYFKQIANPASNISKNIRTEEMHLEGIARRFINS